RRPASPPAHHPRYLAMVRRERCPRLGVRHRVPAPFPARGDGLRRADSLHRHFWRSRGHRGRSQRLSLLGAGHGGAGGGAASRPQFLPRGAESRRPGCPGDSGERPPVGGIRRGVSADDRRAGPQGRPAVRPLRLTSEPAEMRRPGTPAALAVEGDASFFAAMAKSRSTDAGVGSGALPRRLPPLRLEPPVGSVGRGKEPCLWECGWLLNDWVRPRLRAFKPGLPRWPIFYVAAAITGLTTSTAIPSIMTSAPADFRASAPAEP